MDFEFTSAATTTSSKKNTASAAANAQGTSTTEAKRAKETATLPSVNGGGLPHSSANHAAKETIAGTSNTTNPKKRKAAGTPATSTPPVASALTGAAANMRKPQVVPSVLARETNMMTFTKSKACLNKKGELLADDGTKLAVNGEYMRGIFPFDVPEIFWN